MLRPLQNALLERLTGVGRELTDDDPGLVRRALDRLDDQPLGAAPGIRERRRLAQPPGGDRGQLQRLAEQLAAQAGQIAEQCARLEHARAERVGEQHVAAARAVGQTGNAEGRVGAQLERIAVVVVLATHDRVHALQAGDRLEPDTVVAHREVAAFDQREAEIAREQRVLEVGLVVRPGREQDDPRRPVAARRPVAQRGAQGVEERRQVLHRQLAEHLREDARDDEPILERVARARGRLRAVVDDPPAAVGRARQVGGVLQQVTAAGRPQALGGREKAAMAEDHLRRDRAALQQRLRAVEIAEDAVEQVGALRDAGADRLPLVGRQDERESGRPPTAGARPARRRRRCR